MLFLLFHIADDRYALDACSIAEILPLVDMTPIPQAFAGVAGVFNCRGTPVPALDLSALALGRAATLRLSTRLVLVNYPDGRGSARKLGLIAERVTETMRCDARDFTASGISNDATPYLGPVMADARGLVQWVNLQTLLPPALRDLLFREPATM